MRIIFKDGSSAECSEIEFNSNEIIWDEYRYTYIDEVEKIVETEED